MSLLSRFKEPSEEPNAELWARAEAYKPEPSAIELPKPTLPTLREKLKAELNMRKGSRDLKNQYFVELMDYLLSDGRVDTQYLKDKIVAAQRPGGVFNPDAFASAITEVGLAIEIVTGNQPNTEEVSS